MSAQPIRQERVGFIGLGTMGMPMATNLAKAGCALSVYDADPSVRQKAAAVPGMTVAESAQQVAAGSDIVFTCLPSNEIVLAVYLKEGGIASGGKPGLTTCDCSTVSPEVTLEVHRALAGRGIHHLDTPMLGSQPQAVSGEIFFIVGGEQAQVPRVAPFLALMGKMHHHVGAAAMANRLKLIHNGLAAAIAVAVAESLALCVKSGLSGDTFYEVVRQGGGMAYGTYFERRAKRILDGEFSPTFMLELMRKDAALAFAMARQLAVPTPILDETKRTYDEAVDAGWGKEDFSAVSHVVERRMGRKLSDRGSAR